MNSCKIGISVHDFSSYIVGNEDISILDAFPRITLFPVYSFLSKNHPNKTTAKRQAKLRWIPRNTKAVNLWSRLYTFVQPNKYPQKETPTWGWGIRFQQTICSRLVKQLWIWRRVAPWKKSWNSRQQARVGRCPTHVQRWGVRPWESNRWLLRAPMNCWDWDSVLGLFGEVKISHSPIAK